MNNENKAIDEKEIFDEFEEDLTSKELKEYRAAKARFVEFLSDTAPYQTVKFTRDELYYASAFAANVEIFRVPMHCEKCNKTTEFVPDDSEVDAFVELGDMAYDKKCVVDFAEMMEFRCPVCGEYHLVPIYIKGDTVQKVGQYPQFDKCVPRGDE